jgi:TonB family protein
MTWTSLHRDYQLPLGPMASLIKIVEKCRSTLADHWNGTPEKQAAQQKPVTFDRPIVSLFSSDDYPADALRRDLGGTAMIVALIDDKGKMADCAVVETSGVAVLDAQTCIMIRKRGKFTPAIGADGKPARAVFTQRVRWEIP